MLFFAETLNITNIVNLLKLRYLLIFFLRSGILIQQKNALISIHLSGLMLMMVYGSMAGLTFWKCMNPSWSSWKPSPDFQGSRKPDPPVKSVVLTSTGVQVDK